MLRIRRPPPGPAPGKAGARGPREAGSIRITTSILMNKIMIRFLMLCFQLKNIFALYVYIFWYKYLKHLS